MEQTTCKTCLFFVNTCSGPDDEPGGFCRRYPVFEDHLPGDWCGEHKPVGPAIPPASPGLQWLWENGRKPSQAGEDEPDDERFYWYGENDDTWQNAHDHLPGVVTHEMNYAELEHPRLRTRQAPCVGFADFDTAMLAAARAVESSQYLQMEAHRKATQSPADVTEG